MKGGEAAARRYARALLDVALNQLARDVAVQAGYGSDAQNAVNAITLVQLLNQDLDADVYEHAHPYADVQRDRGSR